MQDEWKKPPHIEVAGLTQSQQEPHTLLHLQHFNSLGLRAKVSDTFRHNHLLLSQDLTAAAFSALFSGAANAQHGHRLDVGISVFWHNPQFPEGRESDVILYLRLCSMSWSQQNHVPLKRKKSRLVDEKQEYVYHIHSTPSKTFSGLTALQHVGVGESRIK